MERYALEVYIEKLQGERLLEYHNCSMDLIIKPVNHLSYDSSKTVQNTLFVCKGANFKEAYLEAAIQKGASAYISETDYNTRIPCIKVSDIKRALALVSSEFFGNPAKSLTLIGITGTKGKSTTAYYVKYILDDYLRSQGRPEAGIISSIDTYDGVIREESHLTTPESLELQMHFRNAVDSGIQYVVMEASSQALKYGRLHGVYFDVGIFLNISEDHISPIEHRDMEDYLDAKLSMFSHCRTAWVNTDSDRLATIMEAANSFAEKVLTFGTTGSTSGGEVAGVQGTGELGVLGKGEAGAHGDGEIGAYGKGEAGAHGDGEIGAHGKGEAGAYGDGEVGAHGKGEAGAYGDGEIGAYGKGEAEINGVEAVEMYGYDIRKEGFDTLFRVRCDRFDREFRLTMPGLFNVENALGAIATSYTLRIPEEFVYTGLRKARSSGRMEIFANKNQDRIVIVDYAHNKLSFTKLYEAVKAEFPNMKIVTVFGCPGGKAYLRRRDLGLLAGIHSDKVYLTAEDPGPEDTRKISEDIAKYVRQNSADCELIDDREQAVKESILSSEPGTVILITGKGNETRQKYGMEYVPVMSDVELTRKYLEELEAGVKI